MNKFIISQNRFLTEEAVKGYYHQYYTGYGNEGNPDFVNVLKNTFKSESVVKLQKAKEQTIEVLKEDLPQIIKANNFEGCICMCVPRSKSLSSYQRNQLYFKDAVSIAARGIENMVDGTEYIERVIDTYTTHMRNATGTSFVNNGDRPYEGITVDTCNINAEQIRGRKIILVDDIYTRTVNIDEDCIQALFDNGAKEVIYYGIGYTWRG